MFFNTPVEMSGGPSVIGFDGFFRGAFLYHYHNEWYARSYPLIHVYMCNTLHLYRWKPFDRARFWPDLGPRFADAERMGRSAIKDKLVEFPEGLVHGDERDLDWSTVLKRTFEAYVRGERPNMYGEWIHW